MVKRPYRSFNFNVEVGGLIVGGFSEVSGLQVETEVKEYREGGRNDYMIKRAGPTRYAQNLTLKHGIVGDNMLWDWFLINREVVTLRLVISVILMDTTGSEVTRYNFKDAYPVRWVGPDFNAMRSEVAIEALELAHHGMIVF